MCLRATAVSLSFLLATGGFLAAAADTAEEGYTKPIRYNAEGWRQKITGKESLILHTADGGKTWSDVSPPELREAVKGFNKYSYEDDVRRCASLGACDGKRAWVALGLSTDEIVLEFTEDGGRRWKKIQTPIDADHALISFTDPQHGYLLGTRGDDDRITGMYETEDGGGRWYLMPFPEGEHVKPAKINFRSTMEGWIIAQEGDVPLYHTTDGAKTWVATSPRTPDIVKQIPAGDDDYGTSPSQSAPDAMHKWIAFAASFKKVQVNFTTDGGKHWTETSVPITGAMEAFINFVDDTHGFLLAVSDPASGNEHRWLFGTDDGGKRWYALPAPAGDYPNGITFRTPLEGWVTAEYSHGDFVQLYCTRDGGVTWKHQGLAFPKELVGGYINTQPPIFDGKKKLHGLLPARIILGNPEPGRDASVNYETFDGGRTWRLPARIAITIDE